MSVDIAWDLVTKGPDGDALAESIRAFIDAKFQQTTLPRFINAVHVHSFQFGSVCPEIEIKDICDPLPDFYEDEENDREDPPYNLPATSNGSHGLHGPTDHSSSDMIDFNVDALHSGAAALQSNGRSQADQSWTSQHLPTRQADSHSRFDILPAPFPRSGTPGIPGGTSNMGYFHYSMAGLSGAQTPLAAVAGGGPFATQAWLNDQHSRRMEHANAHVEGSGNRSQAESRSGLSSRARKAGSSSPPDLGSPRDPASPEKRPHGFMSAEKVSDEVSSDILLDSEARPSATVSPTDLQVVARVSYNGDVQMMLTAEVMLDYPMPSFIKIPLRLSITGAAFDGVAIVAYIKKKMHFCFLDPEDAETLVGSAFSTEEAQNASSKNTTIGGLLREIRVETEIGRQESGKQVLKNVGKVERFILEQVRRIFEDEFVFPSYWTFLV